MRVAAWGVLGLVGVVGLGLGPGCSKKKPAPPPPPEVIDAAAPLPPQIRQGAQCGPGLFGHDNPNFCIRLPRGFAANVISPEGNAYVEIEYKDADQGLTLGWSLDDRDLERRMAELEGHIDAGLMVTAEGEQAGGKWLIWRAKTEGGWLHTFKSVSKVSGRTFTCEVDWLRPDSEPIMKDTEGRDVEPSVEACKSLH
ncbi:MAG: hypothetical protein IT370_10330 [Deltaproteobacteria bacterium]|nr:hypothetical protein [Deltaproteobacteria bacterium]